MERTRKNKMKLKPRLSTTRAQPLNPWGPMEQKMQQRPRSSYKSGKAALDTGINYTTNFSYKQTYIAGAESDYSFRGDKRVDNGQGDDGDEWSEYASHLDQLEQEYTSLKETEQKKRLMMAARETTNSYAWVNRDHNNGSSRPSSRASSRSSSSRPQSSHRRERNRTGNNKNDNHINNHNNDTIVDGKGTSGTLPRNKNQLQNLASTTPVTRGDDTLYDLDYSNSDISTAENNPRYQALSLSPHSQSHAHLSSRPQSSYSPRSHPHTHARTRPSPEHHNYLSHATKLSASPLSSHTPSPLRTETGHRTRLSPRSWINSAGDELLDLDLEGIRALIPNQDIINIQLSDAKVGISKLGKQLNKKKLPTKMFYRLSEKYGNILKKKRRRKKKKVVEVDINDSSVDAYAYVSASSHKKRGSKTTKAKKVARKQKNGNKRSHKPQAERSSVKEAMHQIEINTPIKKKSANSSSSQASFRSPYSRVLHMQSQLSSSPNGTAVKTSSSKSKLIRSKSSKRFVGERERGKGRLKGKSAESKRAGVRKSDRLKFSMNTKAAKGKTLSNASLSSSSLFRWKAGDTRMPRTQSAAFLRPDKELVECRLRGGRKEWNVGTEKASIPSYDFMQDTHALKAKHLQRQRAMEAEREKHSAREIHRRLKVQKNILSRLAIPKAMLGTTKSKLSTSLPSSASYSSSSSSSAYELRSRPDGMNSFRIRPRSRYRSKHSSLVSSHSTSLLGGQSIDEFIRSTRATSEKIVRHNDYNPYNEFLEEEHLRRQGASPVKNSSRDDCADNTGSGDEDGSREAMRRTRTAKRQSQIAVADRLSRPKSVHQSNNTPTSDSKMRASTLEKILQDNTH